MKKPTVEELEKILDGEGSDGIEVLPSGEIIVKREEMQKQIDDLSEKVDEMANEIKELKKGISLHLPLRKAE